MEHFSRWVGRVVLQLHVCVDLVGRSCCWVLLDNVQGRVVATVVVLPDAVDLEPGSQWVAECAVVVDSACRYECCPEQLEIATRWSDLSREGVGGAVVGWASPPPEAGADECAAGGGDVAEPEDAEIKTASLEFAEGTATYVRGAKEVHDEFVVGTLMWYGWNRRGGDGRAMAM